MPDDFANTLSGPFPFPMLMKLTNPSDDKKYIHIGNIMLHHMTEKNAIGYRYFLHDLPDDASLQCRAFDEYVGKTGESSPLRQFEVMPHKFLRFSSRKTYVVAD